MGIDAIVELLRDDADVIIRKHALGIVQNILNGRVDKLPWKSEHVHKLLVSIGNRLHHVEEANDTLQTLTAFAAGSDMFRVCGDGGGDGGGDGDGDGDGDGVGMVSNGTDCFL